IRANVETENFLKTAMIPDTHSAPGIVFAGDGIPMGYAVLLVGDGGWVGERSRFHSCMILRGEGRIEKPYHPSHFLFKRLYFSGLVYNLSQTSSLPEI